MKQTQPSPLVMKQIADLLADAAGVDARALDPKRLQWVMEGRCRTLHIGRYPPAATIVETANAERCDLIVMGSHGHGAIGQLFLGSVTARVAATCAVPLLVVRKSGRRARRSETAARGGRRV